MTKQQRNRYSEEFKAEALKLAENTSVSRQLGLDLWLALRRQEKG
mgnify:CR=1 FL=1